MRRARPTANDWRFAIFGWDPEWHAPRGVKVGYVAASALLYAALASLLYFGRISGRSMWLPLVLMALGIAGLSGLLFIMRRELFRRLDMERDEHAAAQIQRRLIPSLLPECPGFDMAHSYLPFRGVGGDYYDVVRRDDEILLITMADVSGKGTGAALLMANLQAILRFVDSPERAPEKTLQAINLHLLRHIEPGGFVTMVLAALHLPSRRVRYANAGHNPPLILSSDGREARLEATGPPLGILETARYEVAEIEVPRGAVALFYTDGLSERSRPDREQFGERRILESLRAGLDRPAHDIVDSLVGDVERFARGAPGEDDTALLVLKSSRDGG
jgi:sigma-B regulation protein RsbU (phosphoserine phosphatase)